MGNGALTADDENFRVGGRMILDPRQDFIDRAAIAIMAATIEQGATTEEAAISAYDESEALWAERERRRNG